VDIIFHQGEVAFSTINRWTGTGSSYGDSFLL
jgi:hypothetical protein